MTTIEKVIPDPFIYAEFRDFGEELHIVIGTNDWNWVGDRGTRAILKPLDPVPVFYDDRRLPPDFEPTLLLRGKTAVALMNALWSAGLRPTVGRHDSQSQVEAMKYHLEDMRRLVFEAEPIEFNPKERSK